LYLRKLSVGVVKCFILFSKRVSKISVVVGGDGLRKKRERQRCKWSSQRMSCTNYKNILSNYKKKKSTSTITILS
jgi:hypothetical protein